MIQVEETEREELWRKYGDGERGDRERDRERGDSQRVKVDIIL